MSEFGGDQGKTEVADRKKGRSKKKNRYSIGWMIGLVVSIVIVLVCLIGVIGFSLCKKDTVAGEWFMLAILVSGVGAFFCAYKAEGDDDGARNVPIYVVTVVMIVAGAVFVAAGRQVNKPHAEIIGVTAVLSGVFLAASTFCERHRDNTRADLDPMARERARRDFLHWRKGQLFYLAALTAVFLIGVLIHNSGEWVTTVISSLVILNQSKDMWKRYVGGDANALSLTGIQDTNQGGDEDQQGRQRVRKPVNNSGRVKWKRTTVFIWAAVFLVLSLFMLIGLHSTTAKQQNMPELGFGAWQVFLALVAAGALVVMVFAWCVGRSVLWTGVCSLIGSFILYLFAEAIFVILLGSDGALVMIAMAFWVLSVVALLIVAAYHLSIKKLPEAAMRSWLYQQLVIPGTLLVVGMVLRAVERSGTVDKKTLTGTVLGVLITLLVIRQIDAAVKLFSAEENH